MKRMVVSLLCAALPLCAVSSAARSADASASTVDARAERLLRAMTLDEKIALLSGTLGVTLRAGDPGEKRIGAGHVPGIARLGVPALYETDASLGVANNAELRPGDVATALPSGLATAASFDPAGAYAGGAMIGAEARAKGFNVLLGGGANLTRDPWAGRNFEYLGEDVLLTGTMAGAAIRGIQSNGIVSTVKHFALNAQETGRHVMDARLAEAPLRESDLLAFQIAIERGQPGAVMCGYNRVNGAYACENDFLLNHVLKRDWRYRGWVMSDWGAVHSAAAAAVAGLDQQSGRELDVQPFFAEQLRAAVVARQVPMTRLDDMVRRILRTLIQSGIQPGTGKGSQTGSMDHTADRSAIDYAAHALVAQRGAENGAVLLRNGGVLPLATNARRIVVIGGQADRAVLSGGGSSQVVSVGGTPLTLPFPGGGPLSAFVKVIFHASSPLQAIRAQAPLADVRFIDGTDRAAAADAARSADVTIVFATQWQMEAIDATTLALPQEQDALIDAVASANPRTVVVLETGGPVLMPWLEKVGAVLEAWYPGQRGGEAIARILFGEVNPSGRLPITFPASADQAPRPRPPGLAQVQAAWEKVFRNPPKIVTDPAIGRTVEPFAVDYIEGQDVGYRWYERTRQTPLFPFGHGLSYTSFNYRGLRVTRAGSTLRVRFSVTNTGPRAGADVPQVYAAVAMHGSTPVRRLVGFQRLELARGETRQVTMDIDPRLIADYDVRVARWRAAPRQVPITLGRFAGDVVLGANVRAPAIDLRP